MRFQDLGLLPELVSNAGYDAPTPVQSESIPAILNGRDVLAGAQTGTGKTAAFILPVMQKLYAGESKRSPRGLVLAPTRELAAQVADSARRYGKGLGLKQTSIFGGVSYGGQLKTLRSGLDLVIATPGRLIDHLNQGSIDLSNVQTLILDEADRMLDMGFVRDIERIISKCHGKRQTLLFSATYNKGIKRLASKYLDNPIEVAVARENTVSESVEQTFVHVDQHRKRELLTQLIGLNDMHQVLVFTKTKYGADKLAKALTGDGLPAVAMHGNKSQAQRTKALQKFKRGAARILVATDLAARGLDIQKLPYVINFELPMVAEDYVHRIGRTGRAGEKGDAISFVCATEHRLMRDIQHLLKIEVEFEVADGFEPEIAFPVKKPKNKPQPRKHGRSNPRGHNGRGRDERPKQRSTKSLNQYDARKNSERPQSANVESGKHADFKKSQNQRDGERVERKQWRDNSSSPRSSKRQRAAMNSGSEWSGKSKYDLQKANPGSSRDGFSPPKRKAVKRSVSAR
ncbi:DEAD/DEAH box helicase [Litorivicinus sp.]|nr:DEAD/DEAH box helicase [Litorivicinus sp.]